MAFALACAAAAAIAAGAPVAAHEARSPLALAVELERKSVTVFARYTIERGDDARALREQFDRDADGRFDDGERAGLRAWLVERARAGVQVRVGDQPLVFDVASVAEELDGSGAARLAVAVRLDAKVTWPARTARLVVACELPEVRAVTPVAVRVGARSKLALPKGFVGGVASKGAPLEVAVGTEGRASARRR